MHYRPRKIGLRTVELRAGLEAKRLLHDRAEAKARDADILIAFSMPLSFAKQPPNCFKPQHGFLYRLSRLSRDSHKNERVQ